VAGQWFSPGTPVSSTNKTDHHAITEILLKVALNTITPDPHILQGHFFIVKGIAFLKGDYCIWKIYDHIWSCI